MQIVLPFYVNISSLVWIDGFQLFRQCLLPKRTILQFCVDPQLCAWFSAAIDAKLKNYFFLVNQAGNQ